ncbi:MAG: hypothetical protein IJ072_01530 [Oscillospiraceae bacterium]|nr:hypothetical protein [Oscillospiraceae bacterium]
MKYGLYLKICFLLSTASLFTPWFTYNAQIMGYCWGYFFIGWFLIPRVILAVRIFTPVRNKTLSILARIASVAELGLMALALGKWQEICNISGGFHWKSGLSTAQPMYWVSAGLFVVFCGAFQYIANDAVNIHINRD